MAVVQQAFYVPPEVMAKVAKGQYKIYGGVVRWAMGPNKGRIVKHLKPIDPAKQEAAKEIALKAVHVVKEHKAGAIAVGVGAAAVVGGRAAYKALDKRIKEKRTPKEVKAFKESLKHYMGAIETGTMSLDKIIDMTNALESVSELSNDSDVKIEVSLKELGSIVQIIVDYTKHLCLDNPIDLSVKEKNIGEQGDNLIDLQSCLALQKRIFEEAA